MSACPFCAPDEMCAMCLEVYTASERRTRAAAERAAAAAALADAVRQAAAGRVSKTRIAEVAGISRQTVHNILHD
jgi:DNA invertase Pin-like site-specific DNA recombinase